MPAIFFSPTSEYYTLLIVVIVHVWLEGGVQRQPRCKKKAQRRHKEGPKKTPVAKHQVSAAGTTTTDITDTVLIL